MKKTLIPAFFAVGAVMSLGGALAYITRISAQASILPG